MTSTCCVFGIETHSDIILLFGCRVINWVCGDKPHGQFTPDVMMRFLTDVTVIVQGVSKKLFEAWLIVTNRQDSLTRYIRKMPVCIPKRAF